MPGFGVRPTTGPSWLLVRIEIALAGRDGHRHAVGVLIVDVERRGRVVDGVPRREIALALDVDRAGVFGVVAPLGQVDHVGAPVGDHAAGEGQVPAEVAVAAGRNVGHPGGLAQPHLVVQLLRADPPRCRTSNRSRASPPTRAVRVPHRQPHFDVLELADHAAADQFDETDVDVDRAVLRGGLKDAAGLLDHVA